MEREAAEMKITKLIDVLMAVKKITGEILGGCDDLLLALLIFMAIEYITCTLAGIYNKKIKEITLDKIIKKSCIILLVAVGNVIDLLIFQNGNVIRTAVLSFYISSEGLGILENITVIGVSVPQKLKSILEQMKDDSSEENKK